MKNLIFGSALLVTASLASAQSAQRMCPCGTTGQLQLAPDVLYSAPITHYPSAPKQAPALVREAGSAPLLTAFYRLLPRDWRVVKGAISQSMPQSLAWPPGKAWYDALGEALLQAGLRADIDWTHQTVTLHTQTVFGNNEMNLSRTAPKPSTLPASAPQLATAPPTTFQIKEKDSFRGALARWSNEAGWNLVYQARRDFTFESSAEFESDFARAVCAVIDDINEAQEELKRPLVDAVFANDNKTVRIVNSDTPTSCKKVKS